MSFLNGETTRTFTVPILDDATDEVDETFTVTLSSPTNGAVLGGTTSATVQINDDDLPPTVQFTTGSQASVNESGSLTITASLSQASAFNVSVPFSVDGSSTATGADYAIPTTSPLTVLAGSLTASITVNITADTTDEANETVVVILGAPTNATLGTTTTHTATITDDDLPPSVAFTSPSQASAGESGTMTVTAQLSVVSSFNVTVPFSIDPSSTAGGGDYGITASPITILAGSLTGDATITITGDLTDEPDETVVLTLNSPTNATLGATTTHTATITDDEGQPSVQFQSVVQNVAESGTVTVTVQLSALSSQTVTVPFAVDPSSTAASPADYTVTSPSPLTISAGSLTGSVSINVNSDALDELNETIVLTLGSPTNATLGAQTTHTATITDDDAPPTVQFAIAAQASVNESGTMTATVTLSAASGLTVTVPFSVEGSSTASASDYTVVTSSPLTFAPGVISIPISVTIASDSIDESPETIVLALGAAINATAGPPVTHTATITDDDAAPAITVSDVTVTEGNGGTVVANFVVSLSAPSGQSVAVTYTTADATAQAGTDYAFTTGSAIFAPGTTVQQAGVNVTGDTTMESDETFVLNLTSPTNATIADAQGVGTIVNDDTATTSAFSISGATVVEGNDGSVPLTFTVTLSAPLPGTATVDYATADGSAAASSDYTPAGGTLTFAPGETSQSIVVSVLGDTAFEDDETLSVSLSNPVGATISGVAATGTITNDDAPAALPEISVRGVSQREGDRGVTPFAFIVELAPASTETVTVEYRTAQSSATADVDYITASSVLAFAPGVTTRQILVDVIGDRDIEPDEVFRLDLSRPVNATLASSSALATIINDDLIFSDLSTRIEQISVGDTEPRRYRVAVTNNGPDPANDVQLVYEVPHPEGSGSDQAILVAAIPDVGTCEIQPAFSFSETSAGSDHFNQPSVTSYGAPTTVVCRMGTLAAGVKATLDVTLVLLANGVMTAVAGAGTADGDPENNAAVLEVFRIDAPAFLVTIDPEPDPFSFNGLVTIVVRGFDAGSRESSPDAKMVIDLPSSLPILSASMAGRPCATGPGAYFDRGRNSVQHVACAAELPPFGFVEARIMTRIAGTASVEASLIDTSRERTFDLPSAVARKEIVSTLLNGSNADLATRINQVSGGSSETRQYRVTVKNSSLGPAEGVILVYEVPYDGLLVRDIAVLADAQPSQGTCDVLPARMISGERVATTTVVCAMGSLAQSATATLDVNLLMRSTGRGVTTATVAANTPDIDLLNNTASLDVFEPHPRPPDLLVLLSHAPASPERGSLATIVARAYDPGGIGTSIAPGKLAINLPSSVPIMSASLGSRQCAVMAGKYSSPSSEEWQHVVCPTEVNPQGLVELKLVAQMPPVGMLVEALLIETRSNDEFVVASAERQIVADGSLLASVDLSTAITQQGDGNNGSHRYRVTVTNNGHDIAEHVRLAYEVPYRLERGGDVGILVAAVPDRGSCEIRHASGHARTSVVCALGSLTAKAEATLDVTLLMLSNTSADMTALALSERADQNPADNRAVFHVETPDLPPLTVTVEHEPEPPLLGALVTIVARAYSRGNSVDSPTAKLAIDLPAGMRVLSASMDQQPCATATGSFFQQNSSNQQHIICGAELKALGFIEARIVAQMNVEAAQVEAFLIDSGFETNDMPFSATDVDVIEVLRGTASSTDLWVVKSGPATLVRGSTAEYTIVVTNGGTRSASNVTVTDEAPSEIVLKTVSGACSRLPCSFATLAPGSSKTIKAVFEVHAKAKGPVSNAASVVADGNTDPNPSNDRSTVVSTIGCAIPAALELNAVAAIASGTAYTLSWSEDGGAASYEVQEATTNRFAGATLQRVAPNVLSSKFKKDVTTDTTFFYRVRAIAACDGSSGAYSRVAEVRVLAPPPPVDTIASLPTTVAPYGSKDPVESTVTLPPTGTKSTFTATTDRTWMTVSPTSGTVPEKGLTLRVKMDPASLPVGASFGTLKVTTIPTSSGSGLTTHAVATTMSVPISVSLVTPVTPSTRTFPPPAGTVVIPGVAHADGVGTQWRSDVRIANPSNRAVSYLVTHIPTQSATDTEVKETTLTVEAGNTTALEDVVRTWFGTSGTGMLEIRPLEGTFKVLATSRTYNATAAGTLGQFVPAMAFARFASRTSPEVRRTLHLPQVAQSELYRTNVGLVEGSGSDVNTLVRFSGTDGSTLLEVPVLVRGGEHRQLNSLLLASGITAPDARIEVSILAGTGKITGYASVIDNRSGDAQLVVPARLPAQATRLVLPGVGSITTPTSRWRSDVHLFNSGTSTATATFSYFTTGSSTAAKSMEIVLQPGSTRAMNDVIGALNMAGTMGVIHIASPSAAQLVASARTYDDQPGGTYGQFISAVTSDDGVGRGEPALQILQVDESVHSRTNVGLFEVSGRPVRVEVTAAVPDWKVSPVVEIDLAANEFIQIGSLLRQMNLEPAYNARISIRAVGGTGRVAAFASSIDNRTQDPTYIPAQ